MRRLMIFAGVLIGVLLPSGTALALAYFGYQQWGGTWHDADKTTVSGDDENMCWAASAADILAWGGWTTSAFNTEAKIFQQVKNYWTNAMGHVENAWSWWINGTVYAGTQSGEAQLAKASGGNYFARDFNSLYRFSNTSSTTMSNVAQYLHDGYGVSLGVGHDISGRRHSLTVWGYEYDSAGHSTGLWVTDSDDYNHSLDYLGVFYDNLKGRWYLMDMNLTNPDYNLWYIFQVQGLYNNFGKGNRIAVAGSGNGSNGTLATGAAAAPEPGGPALLAGELLALALILYRSGRGLRSGITSSGAAALTSTRSGPTG